MGYCFLAMSFRVMFLLLVGVLFSCGRRTTTNGTNPKIQVVMGARAVPAPGVRSIEDSVIVMVGGKIRAVGERRDVPIPQDSARSDATGQWIVPEPGYTLMPGQPANLLVLDAAPVGDIQPNSPQVRRRIKAGLWTDEYR